MRAPVARAGWRPTPWLLAILARVLAAGGLPLSVGGVEAARGGALALHLLVTPRVLRVALVAISA